MSYTESELDVMKDNVPPDNFVVNSLTFVNSEAGLVIEDAISVDANGDMVIKDSETEFKIKDAVNLLSNVIENKEDDADELETIFFLDKNNTKVSLGSLYENLFINRAFSGDRWFTQNRQLQLDYSLEGKLKENFFNEVTEDIIGDDGDITVIRDFVENGLSMSNVWHNIPVEVITDDYVADKYGIISANIPLKYRSTESSTTIFRIFDATAGIELSRTSVELPPVDNDTVINIPLSYQGAMPDSPIAKDANKCQCITIEDLDNLELVNGKDKGTFITEDQDGFYLVPVSKHVIKIQWQTCDMIGEYLKNEDYGRSILNEVSTSLVVDVYNNQQVDDEFLMLNGSFFIGDVDNIENTNRIDIDTTKFNFSDDYVIALSTSKNVEVVVVDNDSTGFTIRWNKPHPDCEISWKITKLIQGVDEDLTQISNRSRELNYSLFKNKVDNVTKRNICNDLDICTESYGAYTFAELLPTTPISGSSSPIPDDELRDGLKEFTMLGYETTADAISGSKTLKFYKTTDTPKYDVYFAPTGTEYGTWRYSGQTEPGSLMRFGYLPNSGFCPQDNESYRLPIATVRVPKIKCNLCDDVNVTYTLVATSGSTDTPPLDCGTQFYHVTDSFGNVAYNLEDDFQFQVGLDTEDTTCTFEISGSSIVGTNDIVNVLKKITYDDTAYGDTYAISGSPQPEIGLFDPADTPTFNDTEVAFLVSDNKILFNVDYDLERFSKYFSTVDNRLLKTTTQVALSGEQYNYIVTTDDTFLGQETLGYQVALFDPFLVTDPVEGDLPKYPNYDPIGNKSGVDEITEYINAGNVHYTNPNFVAFPHFKIGNVAVDGSKYNPLLDYRNYRVVGEYNTYFGTTTFQTVSLDDYNLTQNSAFETVNGERYKVVNDGTNVGSIDMGVIEGIEVEVSRSGIRFVPITDLFWETFVALEGNVSSFD